jgi:hypothetical protein
MGFHRTAFVAGLAVGFLIGSRAGRERYDQIVKYTRKGIQSQPAQQAAKVISAKAAALSKATTAKAASLSRQAAEKGPKVASDAARKARERARGAHVPKISVPKPGWRSGGHDAGGTGTQASVNGHGRHAATDGQA